MGWASMTEVNRADRVRLSGGWTSRARRCAKIASSGPISAGVHGLATRCFDGPKGDGR